MLCTRLSLNGVMISATDAPFFSFDDSLRSNFWIGVTHFDAFGSYRDLMTYETALYDNWATGQPDDDDIFAGIWDHDCVTINKNSGRWSSNRCDVQRGLICQVLPSGNNSVTRKS